MGSKLAPGRSLDEWMELVTACRQSGLTDAAWCNEHGISPSCFYNAVTRLRKKACQIPEPAPKANTLDLTSHKQDVVQIAIGPEFFPAERICVNLLTDYAQSSRNSSQWRLTMHFSFSAGVNVTGSKYLKRAWWDRHDIQKTDRPGFLPVAQK